MIFKTNKNLEARVEKFLKGVERGFKNGKYVKRVNIGIEDIAEPTDPDHKYYTVVGQELNVYNVEHWTSSPYIILQCEGYGIGEVSYRHNENDYIDFETTKKEIVDYLSENLSLGVEAPRPEIKNIKMQSNRGRSR